MPNTNIKRTILIGADPELFVKKTSSGAFITAEGLIPGTKEHPYPVDYGAVQVDGVAAEFNIEPASTQEHFVMKCTNVMTKLKSMIGEGNELVISPTCTFDPTYWETLPKQSKELGCNPDFNAWTGSVNPSPKGGMTTMRTASGHIHIGWTTGKDVNDPDHFDDCRILVKQLDYYLGCPSLVWDADPNRRLLYGKAGAFRPKSYGLEYRVLSNRWLSSKNLMVQVYLSAYYCVRNLLDGHQLLEDKFGDIAQEVINGSLPFWKTPKHKLMSLPAYTGMSIPLEYIDPAWEKKEIKEVKTAKKTVAKFSYSKLSAPLQAQGV